MLSLPSDFVDLLSSNKANLALILVPLASLAFFYLSADSDDAAQRPASPTPTTTQEQPKTLMQAPSTDLAPPKDDPFTLESLKEYDGTNESKPIYVSIKGTVFDVSHKRDTYGPGKSYGIFSGKDASKALGKSSLKPEDAVPDYRDLEEKEMKVLNDWHAFFTKRYNIVGRVTDHPVDHP